MQGALVILLALFVVGGLLFITDKRYFRHHHSADSHSDELSSNLPTEFSEKKSVSKETEGCCGLHIICEKTGLTPVSAEIIYYDDEELDRFKGRSSKEYSFEEIEEFRDVLLTLLPEDVAGWVKSINNRNIELPDDVRDELLMIIADQREKELKMAAI